MKRNRISSKPVNRVSILNEDLLSALLRLSQIKFRTEKEFMKYATEEGIRLTNSKIGYFHLYDEKKKKIQLFSWSKEVNKMCKPSKIFHYNMEDAGVWADSIRLRKPIIHNDYPNLRTKKGYPKGHIPIFRHLSVPIFDQNEIIGVISVGNKEDPYSDFDVKMLTFFTNYLWPILKNLKVEMKLKDYRKHLEHLVKDRTIQLEKSHDNLKFQNELLITLKKRLPINKLLEDCAKIFKDFIKCSAIGIRLINSEGDFPYQTQLGFPEEFIKIENVHNHKSDECLCFSVLAGNFKSFSPHCTENGTFYSNNFSDLFKEQKKSSLFIKRNICFLYSYESLAVIPIKNKKEIIGLFHFADTQPNLFSSKMLELLENAAIQVGNILYQFSIQEELRKNEEKFHMITENTAVGVLILQDMQIKYFNEVLLQLFQIPTDLIYNKVFNNELNLVPKKFIDSVQKFNQKIFNNSQESNKKVEHETIQLFTYRLKVPLWVDVALKKITYEKNPAIIITFTDVTELVEGKRAIEKSEKHIRELMEREINNLKMIDQLKTDFIYRASHELKTPLNAVLSSSKLLLKYSQQSIGGKEKELLDLIEKGGFRLKRLIETLVESLRIEEIVPEIIRKEEDIVKIIKSTLNLYQYLLDQRHDELYLDLPDSLIFSLDQVKMEQVITNLLINAINNTPPSGEITIILKETNKFIEFSIQDTGIGIQPKDIDRLFQKFGKIEQYGKGKDIISEGSGLGLYISKKIVEMHKGKIWAESEGENRGSRFIFRLFKNDNSD
jgi:signal transduction histidine kinase